MTSRRSGYGQEDREMPRLIIFLWNGSTGSTASTGANVNLAGYRGPSQQIPFLLAAIGIHWPQGSQCYHYPSPLDGCQPIVTVFPQRQDFSEALRPLEPGLFGAFTWFESIQNPGRYRIIIKCLATLFVYINSCRYPGLVLAQRPTSPMRLSSKTDCHSDKKPSTSLRDARIGLIS